MQYEKVMEILSYKPEYSFTYECIIEEEPFQGVYQ